MTPAWTATRDDAFWAGFERHGLVIVTVLGLLMLAVANAVDHDDRARSSIEAQR